MLDYLSTPLLNIGGKEITWLSIIIFLAVFFATWALSTYAGNLIFRRLKKLPLQRRTTTIILKVFRIIIFILGTLYAFRIVGIDLSIVLGSATLLLVGISFAFQTLFSNLASGLMLLIEGSLRPGDVVEVDDTFGTVERIGSRAVTIRTRDNISKIIPNFKFITETVTNWSHRDLKTRIAINVGVSYASSHKQVETVLLEISQDHPKILKVPGPQVILNNFGDSSLDFILFVWTATPEERLIISSDLRKRILDGFARDKIEIPFPQRDLWIKEQPQ